MGPNLLSKVAYTEDVNNPDWNSLFRNPLVNLAGRPTYIISIHLSSRGKPSVADPVQSFRIRICGSGFKNLDQDIPF